MDLRQMAEVEAAVTIIDNSWYRPIRGRRYNVEIIDKNNGIVDVEEYVTLAQARQIKREARIDGFRANIREDVTLDNNENEIIFHNRPAYQEPAIKPGFGTPALTPARCAAKEAAARGRNSKRRITRVNEVRYSGAPLDLVMANGFSIYKNGNLVYRGLDANVVAYIREQVNVKKVPRSAFTIEWNGARP
jgi:hypothetical protein